MACAEGLVGDEFDTLKALVFDKLDSIVRASSLVEMVNSLIRPYLNSCKGQITQATLNLIMFYHNHRRYKSGKRQGKAPLELLTGKPLEAQWWELLLQQVHTEQGVQTLARDRQDHCFSWWSTTMGGWSKGDGFRSASLDRQALQRMLADKRTLKRPNCSICVAIQPS